MVDVDTKRKNEKEQKISTKLCRNKTKNSRNMIEINTYTNTRESSKSTNTLALAVTAVAAEPPSTHSINGTQSSTTRQEKKTQTASQRTNEQATERTQYS